MNVGTEEDGRSKYFDYNFGEEISKLINLDEVTRVEWVLMKELHRELNYEAIYLTMKALDWTWFSLDGEELSIKLIQDTALDFIVRFFKEVKPKNESGFFKDPINIPYSHSTAGFTISCYGEFSYNIYFSVTNWNTFEYSDDDQDYLKNHCSEFYNAKKMDERERKIKNVLEEKEN